MSWTNLKATISAVIKANNKQEITGTILNSIFNSVINNLGANASFAGIATPETPLVVQDGPTFWIAGQAGTYNLGGTGVVVGHATLAIFTWDCSTWNYGLIPISGVITVDNLIEAVQEATEQIRADLTSLQEQVYSDLQSYVNDVSYNSNTKNIELKHDNTVLATIDATAFIKDGMVDSVVIENGNLVITFNTESGKEPISIPLSQIFNPSNYYTKVEVNSALLSKANLVNGLVPDAELPKADYQGTTAGIIRLRTNNQGINRSGLTIASDGGMQVHVNNGLRIDGVGMLNANLEENGGLEFGSNNGIQMKTATDADVEEGTSTEKALTPSNMEKIKSEVEDSLLPKDPAAGHDYVEIAGIKWATMNIGAESETDAGLYFQWGDTQGYTADQVGSGEGQKPFAWGDYKFNPSGDGLTMSKYNATDGKTVLDIEDDAAHANWGGSWRMPTKDELQALGNAVNAVWTTNYNGSDINGLLCTDKNDSSKILFFPAAGSASNGSVGNKGNNGSDWSSSLGSNDLNAYNLYFAYGPTDWQAYKRRYYGVPVRGVLDDTITPSSKLHKVAVSGDYNDLENKPDLSAKADLTDGLVPDSELPKADAAGTIAGIVKLRTNGQGVNRSGLTVADGGLTVMTNNGLSIDGVGRLNANIHGAATNEEIAAGTAANKALTPSNLNNVLSVLLGKNFGDTGHTISEILQHVAGKMPILVADVWADQACTVKPTGEVSRLYVRILRADLVVDGYTFRDKYSNETLWINVDGAEWNISYYVDMTLSSWMPRPVTNGVYEISYHGTGEDIVDTTGSQTEFYIDA